MPINLDPSATADIYLDSDENRPPDQRVAFRCRFITYRQRQRVRQLVDQALTLDDDTAIERVLTEALSIGVVGPVGAKDAAGNALPCMVESVWDVLTPAEVWELARNYPNLIGLREIDLKKSASRPESDSATPAASAPAPASA